MRFRALACAGCDLLAALLLSACGKSAGSSNGAPRLVLADSTVLAETDSVYLGKPTMMFLATPSGEVVIPDQVSDRLLRFDRQGRLVRAYGRHGRGPGELSGVNIMTMLVDSVLIHGLFSRIVGFNWSDGSAALSHRNRGNPSAGVVLRDSVFFGIFDYAARQAVAVIPRRNLLSPDSASAVLGGQMVPFFPEYIQYPELSTFNNVLLAAWADTMLVGFGALPYFVRYRLDGQPIDTVVVPAKRRRGYSADKLSLFRAGHYDFKPQAEAFS